MLQFHEDKRPTASKALSHPYLAQYRLANNAKSPAAAVFNAQTPPLTPPPSLFEFDRQRDRLTKEDLKQLIWKELCAIKQECRASILSPGSPAVQKPPINSPASSSTASPGVNGFIVAGRVSSANL
jgi:hypothetical protein